MSSPLSVEYGGASPHMSSPAGDYDYDKYFDFEAYERDHRHHPRSSQGSIHTPALTADSTMTPPLDHFEILDDYASGHLNSLSDFSGFDDEWTYPSEGAIPHDFPPMLNSNSASSSSSSSYSSSPPSYSSRSPASSASSPPSSYPPSPPSFPEQSSRQGRSQILSSSGSGKSNKKRHLHHPEHTAEVRENGACIRCRIRRVRCDLSVCAQCDKLRYLCIHEQLSTIGPVFVNIPHRYAETIRRNELTGRTVRAPISFSATDSHAPKMELDIQAYSVEDGKKRDGPNCAIPRESIPSWDVLARWAGEQILEEKKLPFQSAIESFIIAYSGRYSEKEAPRSYKLPKFDLVDKVRKFSCMFKIWMTQHSSHSNGLYYRGHKHRGVAERLPYSVHEELRHIAKKAMESLERDILSELDGCMTQSRAVKPYEKPLLWACLWQLMFVYRQLYRNSSLVGLQQYSDMTSRLYTGLVAYYTGFFNTPKSLQLDLDLSRSKLSPERQHKLAKRFRTIIDHRLDFYQMLQSSGDNMDFILAEAIAANELKRLLKRRSRKGHASVRGSKVAVPMIVDDEDVEMGYY